MTKEFNSKSEKYLYSRKHFRIRVQLDFFNANKEVKPFLVSINEIVSSLTLFLSGKDLRDIDNGLYIGDLIVSFCRSHFIACDLIINGELVEAVTIIRKQIELLGRLNELSKGLDIERLIKKTPNIKHLKTKIKRLYSEYSEIAHSASSKVMQLLGKNVDGSNSYTTLYPEFQENSFVSLQHLALTVFEYFVWCSNFHKENFDDYESDYDISLLNTAIRLHENIFSNDE